MELKQVIVLKVNYGNTFTIDNSCIITRYPPVTCFNQQEDLPLIQHWGGTVVMNRDFEVIALPSVITSSALAKQRNNRHRTDNSMGINYSESLFSNSLDLLKNNGTDFVEQVSVDCKKEPMVSLHVFRTARSLLSGLDSYMKTQAGTMPIYCAVCGSMFTHTSSLKLHMRIHTGEKPYQCDACGTSFNQSSHLQRHLRTYTREKPFQCIICVSRFSQSSSLNHHIRTHTGGKPFDWILWVQIQMQIQS